MDVKARLKHKALFQQCGLIGGVWHEADKKHHVTVTDPATGKTIGMVPNWGREETKQAIDAAEKAFVTWRAMMAKERSDLLYRWYELIMQNVDDLSTIMTAEQGKPLSEAKVEIVYAASFVKWFAEEARRVYGQTIPAQKPHHRINVIKQPIGVSAAITPWNFPASMVTRKISAALAAGCSVVLKPDSKTPYSALSLAKLAEEAGIPAGVINIVTGKADQIGKELCENPIVRKLSFTGSTAIGKLLYKQCADTVKKISLELGGNAPFIIFDDANLDKALEGVMASKFRNSGQTCVCANRILVQAGVYDVFAKKLEKAVSALKVGNGFEADVKQGPLIEEDAVKKVERLLKEAVKKGAIVTQGGNRIKGGGTFFEPTVITGTTPDMSIAQEEIFGPIASLLKFKDEKEAIAIANDTPYGLASYFYTQDIARAIRVSEALEYGMVGINEGAISTEIAPFGGYKESGIGREGSLYGIHEYLETKYVCTSIG